MNKYCLYFSDFTENVEKTNNNTSDKFFISGCASALNLTDSLKDCIVANAFEKSLLKSIKMRYEHKYDIDGKWTDIISDKNRNELWVKGFLFKNNSNTWLIDQISKGKLKGLSIGCYIKQYLIKNDVRYLIELDLEEISLVFQPTNIWATFKPHYEDYIFSS